MRFALLLYLDPAAAARSTPEQADAELSAYADITEELAAGGLLRGGAALMPAACGTVVVAEGGRRRSGPAPRADLELSGIYLIEADEQDAIAIASRMPVAAHGAVEVRPLLELPGEDAVG